MRGAAARVYSTLGRAAAPHAPAAEAQGVRRAALRRRTSMRLGVILGVVLIALGAWAATGNASYKTKRDVVTVGDFKASVREEHTVPPWVGYVGIGAGILVLMASVRRRS